jgi:putative hydrolase of the HAD superfamily
MIRFMLFDVDDTLYPRSSSLFPMMRDRIVAYIMRELSLSAEGAQQLRQRYLEEYGTATRGLIIHRQINVHDYLTFVHDLPVQAMLVPDPALAEALGRIPVEKCLFTNATRQHALNVTEALGITRFFSRAFGLEDFNYVSKPDPLPYRVVLDTLGARPDEVMMLEDSARNLLTAHEMGMRTVYVDGHVVDAALFDYHIERVHQIVDVARQAGIV